MAESLANCSSDVPPIFKTHVPSVARFSFIHIASLRGAPGAADSMSNSKSGPVAIFLLHFVDRVPVGSELLHQSIFFIPVQRHGVGRSSSPHSVVMICRIRSHHRSVQVQRYGPLDPSAIRE
jgi:hypothetical protein